MKACLLVGLGGFVGAVSRYLIGLLPVKGDFPVLTLFINLVGAVLIGMISSLAEQLLLQDELVLLLKTGLCGGFTTFSTFSLETVSLFEKGKWLPGVVYVLLSVLLCIAGVYAGKYLIRLFGLR